MFQKSIANLQHLLWLPLSVISKILSIFTLFQDVSWLNYCSHSVAVRCFDFEKWIYLLINNIEIIWFRWCRKGHIWCRNEHNWCRKGQIWCRNRRIHFFKIYIFTLGAENEQKIGSVRGYRNWWTPDYSHIVYLLLLFRLFLVSMATYTFRNCIKFPYFLGILRVAWLF